MLSGAVCLIAAALSLMSLRRRGLLQADLLSEVPEP
jgi:hypothetical protein